MCSFSIGDIVKDIEDGVSSIGECLLVGQTSLILVGLSNNMFKEIWEVSLENAVKSSLEDLTDLNDMLDYSSYGLDDLGELS